MAGDGLSWAEANGTGKMIDYRSDNTGRAAPEILDAIYIGPSDLSISFGYPPGGDKPDQWMMDALKKVLDACNRHNVMPGIHCGAPSYAKQMIEMGFRFVTVGGDTRFLTTGAAAAVKEMRGDAPTNPARAGVSSPY